MYLATINDSKTPYSVSFESNDTRINDQPMALDIIEIDAHRLHVICQNQSYNIEIISKNTEDQTVQLKINHRLYHVSLKTEMDLMLQGLGLDTAKVKKVKDLKSPMPGLVLKILVEEGQAIEQGDAVLVLESMKMENILKASNAGIVAKIGCRVGQNVDKNEVLIHIT